MILIGNFISFIFAENQFFRGTHGLHVIGRKPKMCEIQAGFGPSLILGLSMISPPTYTNS